VLLKQDGKQLNKHIKNKHHLYILMSQYMKSHPTQKNTPMRLRIAGLPPPKEPLPEPAVPRGWKMNAILPLHSPALTGGGVSENFLQDMMAEMQGGIEGASGSAASSGGEGKKKKDKKKK
jgi:signal recognition particle subunit SRP19